MGKERQPAGTNRNPTISISLHAMVNSRISLSFPEEDRLSSSKLWTPPLKISLSLISTVALFRNKAHLSAFNPTVDVWQHRVNRCSSHASVQVQSSAVQLPVLAGRNFMQ
jgi:hypothetical protein